MKYQSISLNNQNNQNLTYSLIKYNEHYQKYLPELRKLDKKLVNYVILCPKIYNNLSEYQSYMIFEEKNKCVGATYINAADENLKVELHLNKKYLTDTEIVNLIETFIESLKLYFYNKEQIELKLINKIDLTQYKKDKYQKNIYDEDTVTFTCSNKNNNILIPSLINEITKCKQSLIATKSFWQEDYIFNDLNDIDKPIYSTINNFNLEEMFYKVEKIQFNNILTAKTKRNIIFSRNGDIKYQKTNHCRQDEINYNILENSFTINSDKKDCKENITLVENDKLTKIKTAQLNILYLKDKKALNKKQSAQ